MPPLLDVTDVSKRFGSVVANDNISLRVGAGEIHALLGENGAGKSTFVKIVYGVVRPDAGSMRFAGSSFAPASPADARARGIGIVFQHFSLFEALTVAENIALGLTPANTRENLKRRIASVTASYGLHLDPNRLVGTLSAGERQRVEIVRCLLQDPKLIIMDEPTSVLTPHEVEALFATLRRLSHEGRSILYISHKLDEIRALCSTATVLRAGRVSGACDPRAETSRSLAELMIGKTFAKALRPKPLKKAPVRLQIDRLTIKAGQQFGVDLDDISLEVQAGEVLGIAGVAGNGQAELMQALIGERLCATPATMTFDGQGIGRLNPAERRELGVAFVPEERLGHAAVPDLSLADNTLLTARATKRLSRPRGFIDFAATQQFAAGIIAAFGVRSAGVDRPALGLSGGNLQKFVVGREIMQSPSLLIVAQPTWGVDAGATAVIHRALLDLAADGAAVLVISQDLDELFAIAHRIAVIARGKLGAATPVELATVESIGLAMGGQSATPTALPAARARTDA